MKRIVLVLLVAVTLVLSSCATRITVRHLVPGEVDLSMARNIALRSTLPYRFTFGRPVSPWISGLQETDFTLSSGYDSQLVGQVAKLTSEMLFSAVDSTKYFTTLPPHVTDAYLQLGYVGENTRQLLKSRGVQAILSSEVTYMDIDESVVGRDIRTFVTDTSDPSSPKSYEKVTSREYFLIQKATMTFTYSVIDLQSDRILITRSYTGKQEKETKIGVRVYNPDGKGGYHDERTYSSGYAPSFKPLFEKILKSYEQTIAKELAPSWQTYRVALMANKPKLAQAESAFDLVKAGSYAQAQRAFIFLWQTYGHLSSGYNAALLAEAMGNFDEALDLMNTVYNTSGSPDAYKQLLRLKEVASNHEKAKRQISGDTAFDGQGVLMTQFVVME